MANFELDDLVRLLASCAGVEEEFDLNNDVLDTEFVDLGYDSLALLEVAGQVSREYGVPMPDNAPEYMLTPRAAIDFINELFATTTAKAV
jgi:acyl carrier protein